MGAAAKTLRHLFSIGWKLVLVAIIAAFIIYRVRFAPVPVESHIAATGPIVSEVMGTGTLEPRVQATISAKISGRIAKVHADQGDRVTKGQLLATLDDGDLRQQVQMARAELNAVRASVERAAADIARAQATAVEARTLFGRHSELFKQKLLSDADLDKATQQRDVAEAELRRTQLAKVEVERQVVKAEETLRYYEERLSDTRILSPFDGLITRRSREPGDIVVPGAAILQVISTAQMWVSAWVDESAMASLAIDQPARIVFRSDPDKSSRGTVTRLAPLADRETREFLVDVTVTELPATWVVGQRAEVYIQTARKDQALLVPQRAILWRQGRAGLYVADAGRARWRDVSLGLRGADFVEIIRGISPGQAIVWPREPASAPLAEGKAVTLP